MTAFVISVIAKKKLINEGKKWGIKVSINCLLVLCCLLFTTDEMSALK